MYLSKTEVATLACATKVLISELANEVLDDFVDGDKRVIQNETELMELEAKLAGYLEGERSELKSSEDKYECLGVSIAHLSETDCNALDQLVSDPECNMVMSRDTGWFVKLFDEADANMGYHGMSDELHRILSEALKAGYRMVEFDADASRYQHFKLMQGGV